LPGRDAGPLSQHTEHVLNPATAHVAPLLGQAVVLRYDFGNDHRDRADPSVLGTFTWVTSILGYGRSPSMVIVGPSVRFELCNPDLSEISVTAQTRGKPLPGTRSIVAPHLCPMGTERGTPRCLHSWPDFWRIFNAAPLRMQVLDRALTT